MVHLPLLKYILIESDKTFETLSLQYTGFIGILPTLHFGISIRKRFEPLFIIIQKFKFVSLFKISQHRRMSISSCCSTLEQVINYILQFFRKFEEGKSIFSSLEKHGYSYANFDKIANRHFVEGKMIAEITKSKSPLEEIPFFRHYEIILKIDYTYFRFSFANNGLTIDTGSDKYKLLLKRKRSQIKSELRINRKIEDLKQFLIAHQDTKYNLLFWNCKDFAQALWKYLTNNQ